MITRPPLIGLSGRRKVGADVRGLVANMDAIDVDIYISPYARAVTAAGGLPVHLPQHVDPAEYAGRLDGVVLSGGADVDPSRYGAIRASATQRTEPDRDRFELALVDLAVDDGLPVLGICRGLQLLNVWAGGTLHQHVPGHGRYDIAPDTAVDGASVVPGTVVHDLVGDHVAINSLHHQSIDEVAPGWVVAAVGTDGTIEAIEWPGHDVVAVQWHPELMSGAATEGLFGWLVRCASGRVVAGS
ncbi:MAG: gamma-glutamyl-gamma-aminobutyrate hydrolase family protein [Ilumatobacteraceae bacterium]